MRFVVSLSAEKMREAEAAGFHKKFKLEGSINTSNLVSFGRLCSIVHVGICVTLVNGKGSFWGGGGGGVRVKGGLGVWVR